MSDLLSIGATGVRAYQTALTTTSENIANAGTAGYARRTTNLSEVAAPKVGGLAVANGMGVIATGVTRAADLARAAEVRTASGDLAKTESSIVWLDRIESALTGNKLSDRLTDFFNSANAVAADPSALAPRATMLEAASSVASAFTATGAALDAAAADLDQSAEGAVTELNNLLAGLAKVNAGLGRAAPNSSGAAALLDERDRLLESMSAITDVDASFDSWGRATVRAGGGGPALIAGDTAGIVTYVRNDSGAVSFAVHLGGETQAIPANAGALAGIADGASRIASARTQLNALATSFVDGANAVQANGRDLSGVAGEPMFEAGDPPSRISMTLTDPRGIAAASVGGGARDNSNLAGFDTLRTSGAYESKLTDLVTANAAALSARTTLSGAQSAIRDSAIAARDSASGVSIDEEAVDLLRFQQAYQASSRVIQIARETLQAILDIR